MAGGKKTLLFVFLIVNLIVSSVAYGQFERNVSKVGTTAAPFLEIEVGSRAVGMGGAFVAVANDVTAIYWNPAGLSRISNIEVILIHANWLVNTYLDFAGIAFPLGQFGTVATSITSLSTGEMEVRTVERPDGTGERFSYGDLSLGLSFARNLTDRFSIGFNGKYISQRIWHMSASTYAVDIGTLFRTQFNGMLIGMSISNFGGSMRLEGKDVLVNYDEDPALGGSNEQIPALKRTDEFPLPLLFRVGVAMNILNGNSNRLMVALDAVHPNDNTEYVNVGAEYVLSNMVVMRLGYKGTFTRDTEEGLTAGGGVRLKMAGSSVLRIDYAYQNFGRLENTQRISLGIDL